MTEHDDHERARCRRQEDEASSVVPVYTPPTPSVDTPAFDAPLAPTPAPDFGGFDSGTSGGGGGGSDF